MPHNALVLSLLSTQQVQPLTLRAPPQQASLTALRIAGLLQQKELFLNLADLVSKAYSSVRWKLVVGDAKEAGGSAAAIWVWPKPSEGVAAGQPFPNVQEGDVLIVLNAFLWGPSRLKTMEQTTMYGSTLPATARDNKAQQFQAFLSGKSSVEALPGLSKYVEVEIEVLDRVVALAHLGELSNVEAAHGTSSHVGRAQLSIASTRGRLGLRLFCCVRDPLELDWRI